MYTLPAAKWVETKNYSSRHGHEIQGVAIHVTEGSIDSVDDWFVNSSGKKAVSAHYCVLEDGGLHQYVNDLDSAWHAGRVLRPTAGIVLDNPGVNPNLYLLGIEHEGSGTKDFTEKQYETSSTLLALRSVKYGFPLDAHHVVGHHSVFADKTCPGPIDLARLIKMAVGKVQPQPGEVRWSGYFNSNITLVEWQSDSEWTFRVPGRGVFRAGSKWSIMQPAK